MARETLGTSMHRNFADWYRGASLAPGKDELAARWEAVNAAVEVATADRKLVLPLTEAAFGLGGPAGAVTWFVDAMKAADPTLPIEDNENGIATLAGCTLAVLLTSTDSDWSDLATLIHAAAFQGRRPPNVVPAIVRLASEVIGQRQRLNRQPGASVDVLPPAAVGKSVEQALTAMKAEFSGETTATAIQALVRQIAASNKEAFAGLQRQFRRVSHENRMLREETDMLWWVIGGWVREIDAPIGSIPPSAAGLVIGWALAGMTNVNPAPLAMGSIFERAFRQCDGADVEAVTVEDAIAAMPPALLQAWAMPGDAVQPFARLAPLTLAIARAAEDAEGWKRPFAQATRLPPDTALTGKQMAWQAYNERLAIAQFRS